MGIEVALIAAAAVSAGASRAGSSKAASASKKAAKGVDARFQETKALLQPFVDSGTLAKDALETSLGLKGQEAQADYYKNFQTDPGFTEATNFGLKKVDDSYNLSGRGGGNLLAALSDRARNDMMGAFSARQSALSDLAGKGISAAGTLAGAGTTSAAQSGQLTANAGMLQGSGIVNAGNAAAGALDQYSRLKGFQQGQTNASALSPWQTSVVPTNRLSF